MQTPDKAVERFKSHIAKFCLLFFSSKFKRSNSNYMSRLSAKIFCHTSNGKVDLTMIDMKDVNPTSNWIVDHGEEET